MLSQQSFPMPPGAVPLPEITYYHQQARREMLPFVPVSARRILEAGCGGGIFGEQLKFRGAAEVWGIEPFSAAAAQARNRIDKVFECSIESAVQLLPEHYFDCIVFNDVLEHLHDPWQVLSDLKGKVTSTGCVVASIPNVRFFEVLKALTVRAEWRYQRDGVLDRTHLRFFTRQTIEDMFTEVGYELAQVTGINAHSFPWKVRLLNRLLLGSLDDTRYIQYACVAHPVS